MKLVAFLLASAGLITLAHGADFAEPLQVKGGGTPIQVESPGYAAPCLADLDGDGKLDLLVGQFNGGKINVYRGLGGGRFASGEWLKADGKVAKVPGVW